VSGTRFGPRLVAASLDPNAGLINVYNGTEAAWAPFAGLRPSLELIAAPLAVGVAIWTRFDLLQLAPDIYLDPALFPNAPGSPLNRLSFGADLHLAFHFD